MRRLLLCLAIAGLAVAPSSLMAGEQEDQATVNQIFTKLTEGGKAGQLKGFRINAKAKDGTVWLTGTVRSQQQMQAALDIVQDVPGIDKIMNGLQVAGADTAVQQTAVTAVPQAQFAAQIPVDAPVASRPQSSRVAQASHSMPQPPLAMGPAAGSRVTPAGAMMPAGGPNGSPIPAYMPSGNGNVAPAHFDRPNMPGYAWPSYASAPNYAAVTYPRQYSPTAWPFIGPFYPYPQVPLGWRKVTLEWHNGWWMLDFNDGCGAASGCP